MPRRREQTVERLEPQALKAMLEERFPDTTYMGNDPLFEIERILTGILAIDDFTGGGFPRGRYVELFGSPSVGKTYTAYRLIASAQSQGLTCSFVDVEDTYDADRAASLNIDTEALIVHRQKHGPHVIDFIESLVRMDAFDVIVVDSIAALLPMAEYENDMEAGSMGMEQAKLMSKALRKITAADKRRRTVKVFINQTRDSMSMFQKAVTAGGRAMGFYASVRIELATSERIKEKRPVINPSTGKEEQKDVVVGHRVLARMEKNKVTGGSNNQATTTFVFNYEEGAHDHVEDLVYLGRTYGYVIKNGDYWHVDGFEDERQHGRTRFVRWLRENVAVAEELAEWITSTPYDGEQDEEDE